MAIRRKLVHYVGVKATNTAMPVISWHNSLMIVTYVAFPWNSNILLY